MALQVFRNEKIASRQEFYWMYIFHNWYFSCFVNMYQKLICLKKYQTILRNSSLLSTRMMLQQHVSPKLTWMKIIMFLQKQFQLTVIVVLTCSQCCTMLCFFFRGEDDAKPRIYHCLLSLGALSLLILPGSDIRPGA